MTAISTEAQEVLKAIKTETNPPDDMPDHKIWSAERELQQRGLIYRDDNGEWAAR